MNGFNPLGGLKEWHVKIGLILVGIGIVTFIVSIVKFIIWIANHVEII